MTTALCLNCGETKFGAWCPCGKCRVESSGDRNLDILFSDHRMTVSTLTAFGTVIKQIAQYSDDSETRFWVFIAYLSSHPAKLLSAMPPPEIADHVESILAQLQLPIVEAVLKPIAKETGPPQRTIPFPDALLQKYTKENRFDSIERVQIRRRDGFVVNGMLIEMDGSRQFCFRADIEVAPDEIQAVRMAPGCLLGWVIKPKWVEA